MMREAAETAYAQTQEQLGAVDFDAFGDVMDKTEKYLFGKA